MTREELIAELKRLIATARENHMPTAAILSALVGSLYVGSETDLMDIVAAFSRDQIRILDARNN